LSRLVPAIPPGEGGFQPLRLGPEASGPVADRSVDEDFVDRHAADGIETVPAREFRHIMRSEIKVASGTSHCARISNSDAHSKQWPGSTTRPSTPETGVKLASKYSSNEQRAAVRMEKRTAAEIGAVQRLSGVSKSQQHERLIVQNYAGVDDGALTIEPVNIEPIVAPSTFNEKIDIGFDHVPPGTAPPDPAEFAIRKNVTRLHKEAVRARVALPLDR
jgi:hypothetical protein